MCDLRTISDSCAVPGNTYECVIYVLSVIPVLYQVTHILTVFISYFEDMPVLVILLEVFCFDCIRFSFYFTLL